MLYLMLFIAAYFSSFAYIPAILDKKTTYKNDGWTSPELKYNLLFCFVNIICFFFIEKIKESRKIDYYKDRVRNIEQNYIDTLGIEYLSNETKKEYLKMKRYLKIKKINK